MARRQEAGRGRRGRVWTDSPGNFAATLLLRPEGGPADAARLSFVAALAVFDALRGLGGPQLNLSLKWPNDVLLNGGKLSGILLESSSIGAGVTALAIGIGINLAQAPGQAQLEAGALRAVSLREETGLDISLMDMLTALAGCFHDWSGQMDAAGFAPIRAAWLARAAGLGQQIVARSGKVELTGRFEGMDDSGALLLATSRGRQVLPAADIYFREG